MNNFEMCERCKLLSTPVNGTNTCPFLAVTGFEFSDVEQLRDIIPISRWYTPKQLGEDYGYSAKHALRLVREKGVTAIEVEGRWFVLYCSFTRLIPRK